MTAYRVTLASHGNEGLQQVEKNGLNMVFLDIQMPDMSGLDVLREIRRRGHQIPVAMITAYGSIDRAVEAMKQGAYDFITKPFDPDYIALVAGKGMARQQVQREIEIPTKKWARASSGGWQEPGHD
jgi:DNA-binding NtrC family response regulator